MQQCCAWACTLVRYSTRNMSQLVATGWPNARNIMRSTMLRHVTSKCCDRLAGTCKCWANNVGICCVEMLVSFGRNFTFLVFPLVTLFIFTRNTVGYLLMFSHKNLEKRSADPRMSPDLSSYERGMTGMNFRIWRKKLKEQ